MISKGDFVKPMTRFVNRVTEQVCEVADPYHFASNIHDPEQWDVEMDGRLVPILTPPPSQVTSTEGKDSEQSAEAPSQDGTTGSQSPSELEVSTAEAAPGEAEDGILVGSLPGNAFTVNSGN